MNVGVAAVLGAVALALAAGCALPRQMLAAPGDLADYRLVRTAADEGRRLYDAQRYLARHPDGAFVAEVRALFDAEEAAWFEGAKTSRSRAREYVVDLPDGPHVDAARALLVLFDARSEDVDTLVLLAEARRTGARLDREDARRRKVAEVVLAEVAALLDPTTWGTRLEALPAAAARALRGPATVTWGAASHARRQDELFFVVPTPSGAEERVADVTLQLWLEDGRVADGLVEGEDLWVRWAEATLVRVLDAGSPADRRLAADAVVDRLTGALEASLPTATCATPSASLAADELLRRECRGWVVSVRAGRGPGTVDTLEVRGPPPTAAPAPPASARSPGRAPSAGMR